jgi:hypothetical protein
MQYLLVSHVLLYVFASVAYLVLCGIESAILVFAIVMPSSHIIVASLCCSVDHFIPVVAILRYDYKPALNIVVGKLYGVGTYKP